jgi:predicted MFS family arabinose efflux permease
MLWLLAAILFVNGIDYLMVLPLGPDFARGLRIPLDRLGLISASYMVAASVAGVVLSPILDRFERRVALGTAVAGLVCATVLAGFATGLRSMIVARAVAGACGGAAVSLIFAIVADVIPPERRGSAVGTVRGALSVASVLGIPIGLWLSQWVSWRAPFLAVGGLGLVVAIPAVAILPPLRDHLAVKTGETDAGGALWRRPEAIACTIANALQVMGNFALIPFFTGYLLFNLGFARSRLSWLYVAGGVITFFALRLFGRLSDRIGELPVAAAGTLLFELMFLVGYVVVPAWMPGAALYIGVNLAMAGVAVPTGSLTSRVPRPNERAKFMSIQTAVQFGSSATAALVASQFVHAPSETSPVTGVAPVALVCMGIAALAMVPLWRIRHV